MASIVLSGNSPFSYTNNTGQNVRVVINYLYANITNNPGGNGTLNASFAGITIQYNAGAAEYIMGKNLPITTGLAEVLPNEIYLSAGQTINISTFYTISAGQTITNGDVKFNILIIPENG